MEEGDTKQKEEQADAKEGDTEEVDWAEAAERARESCRKRACFLTGDPDVAEDIAQSAVEKTWRKHRADLQAFPTAGALIAYARCCVLTEAIDHPRPLEGLTDQEQLEDIGEGYTTLTLEEIAMLNDARSHWEKMIGQLDPQKRELLELKRGGLNWGQIATETGQTDDAAKRMYYRTLKHLHQGLQEYYPDL